MPTYLVNLDITGTVTLQIDGEDGDDALDNAEQLFCDSSMASKLDGHKVTIEIGTTDPQQATEVSATKG